MFEFLGLDYLLNRKSLVSREDQEFLNLEVKQEQKAY